MFGSSVATTTQKTATQQDWSNPFDFFSSPAPTEAPPATTTTHTSNSNSPMEDDARSITSNGTRGSVNTRSSVGGYSANTDYRERINKSRDDYAQQRALEMSHQMDADGSMPPSSQTTLATPMTPKQSQQKLQGGSISSAPTSKKVNRTASVREKLASFRLTKKLTSKTETTRPKKPLTDEDVRDPETVPGMKSKSDITMEETAQERALMMVDETAEDKNKVGEVQVKAVNSNIICKIHNYIV
jgi:hypothetical protein